MVQKGGGNMSAELTEKLKNQGNCPRCNHDLPTHPEGACLDALFIEKVLGWPPPESPNVGYFDWSPSTNIAHAMEGIEKVKQWRGCVLENMITNSWTFRFERIENTADRPELAITRALVMWAMEKEK